MSTQVDKAAPLEIISSENAERFQVTFRMEILHLLKEILEQKAFIRAFFPDKTQSFLTSLVAIDEANNLVAFDVPMHAEVEPAIGDIDELIMSTAVDNVQVQFAVNKPSIGKIDDLPVFYTEVPESVMRLQRREFYRLVTSTATPIICEVPVGNGVNGRLRFNVYDISVGGAAVLDIPVERAGTIIKGVRFFLPDEGMIVVDLSVRNVFEVTLRSGAVVRRIGCAFTHLSQLTRTTIQRFILKIERERKAKGLKIDE